MPVIFQVSGRTLVDPHFKPLSPSANKPSKTAALGLSAASCNDLQGGLPAQINFTNDGDAPASNLVATVSTSAPGAVSAAISAGGSGNIPPPAAVASLASVYPYAPYTNSPYLADSTLAANGSSLPAGLATAAQAATSLVSPLSIVGASTFNLGTVPPGSSKSTPAVTSVGPTGQTGSASLVLHSSAPCGGSATAALSNPITSQLMYNPPLYVTETYTNGIGQRITVVKELSVPTSP